MSARATGGGAGDADGDTTGGAGGVERFDLVIAGGGPAGLAVAIEAASRGFSTVVIERAAAVPDKACGEGLMPAGVRALDRLLSSVRLDPRACARFTGIRYQQEDGAFVDAPFRDGAGLGVRRTALVAALSERSLALGVRLRRARAVRSRRLLPDAVLVDTDAGTVAARLLVAADGLGSPLRIAAGLDLPARGRRFGLRRHFRIAPACDRVEVHWSSGVEAYLTPVGPEQLGVAFLWDASRLDGHASFANLLSRFPAIAARLDGAAPISSVRGAGPLSRRARSPIADRLVLVGDAAGYVDAITGEGLTLAFLCAEALGALLPTVLDRGATRESLEPYRRAFHHHYRRYAFFARALVALSRRPRLRRRALDFLVEHPAAFESLVAQILRCGSEAPRTAAAPIKWVPIYHRR